MHTVYFFVPYFFFLHLHGPHPLGAVLSRYLERSLAGTQDNRNIRVINVAPWHLPFDRLREHTSDRGRAVVHAHTQYTDQELHNTVMR